MAESLPPHRQLQSVTAGRVSLIITARKVYASRNETKIARFETELIFHPGRMLPPDVDVRASATMCCFRGLSTQTFRKLYPGRRQHQNNRSDFG